LSAISVIEARNSPVPLGRRLDRPDCAQAVEMSKLGGTRTLASASLGRADEPLGNLDSLTRLSMQGEIVNLWRRAGFTVLMVTHDIEEALLMATRVIVLSDRPAVIKADIAVDKAYPRHRDDPDLVKKRQEALGLLGLESSW
jgi:ABC-type nitrate/sulfonate/bicarbonate transport system ATPase subunit